MINPTANQPKNHNQLEPDIPVNKYRHDTNPKRGIKENFFKYANTERIRQVNQNIIVAILTEID